jgi:hypothetical protein
MPERVWLARTGQLETCRACQLSFSMVPGESTSSLVHRCSAWRDTHADCQLPEQDESSTDAE